MGVFSSGIALPADTFSLADKKTSDISNSPIIQALSSLDSSNPIYNLILEGADSSAWNTHIENIVNLSVGSTINAVMNGSMNIWQRGISFTSVATNAVTADRWRYITQNTTAVHDITRSTDIPPSGGGGGAITSGNGFTYSLKIDCTTADASLGATDLVVLVQRIESPLVWFGYTNQTLTLSFWVKATKTGSYSIALQDNPTNSFSYIAEYTVSAADTWEKKEITIPAYTGAWSAAEHCQLVFTLMAGSNFQGTTGAWTTQSQKYAGSGQVNACDSAANNFFLTGVQLERGSTATGFELLNFTSELLRCMRYYEKSFQYGTTPAYGVSWTLGRPAVGVQVVGASTSQPMVAQAVFRVPKATAAVGGNTTLYNPVTASSAQFRNITAAADCTANAYTSASEDHLTFSSTTPAGSAAGQVLALHWATNSEL